MNEKPTIPLPSLKQLLPTAFTTLFRSKNIGSTDFTLERSFLLEKIDQKQLSQYIHYFGFRPKEAIPLSYLYLIAQPAQIALMLDRQFPLPLPGMVHFNNRLILLSEINPQSTLTLHVSAFIEAKAEGSLFPKMTVDFFQGGQKVAICESGYFVRRKSVGKKKKRKEEAIFIRSISKEHWTIPGNASRTYARLSGDVNPIHLSGLFARMAGFQNRIIHGWYSLSRAVAQVSMESNACFREISVDFKKPLLIGGNAVLEYGKGEDTAIDFVLRDEAGEVIFMSGQLGY